MKNFSTVDYPRKFSGGKMRCLYDLRTSSILKLFFTILRQFQRNYVELILLKKKLGRLKKIPYVRNQDNIVL